jgi:hypothetical protein
LLVSTLSTAGALVFLYLIADQLLGETTARTSVLLLAAYPTPFFLMPPFTESLFICLRLSAFLAAYRRRWWLVGPPTFLASLTRGRGMLSAAALVWLGWVQWDLLRFRPGDRRAGFLAILETSSVVLFVAILFAMLIKPSWRRGDWLIYMGLNLVVFTGVHTFEASAW